MTDREGWRNIGAKISTQNFVSINTWKNGGRKIWTVVKYENIRTLNASHICSLQASSDSKWPGTTKWMFTSHSTWLSWVVIPLRIEIAQLSKFYKLGCGRARCETTIWCISVVQNSRNSMRNWKLRHDTLRTITRLSCAGKQMRADESNRCIGGTNEYSDYQLDVKN